MEIEWQMSFASSSANLNEKLNLIYYAEQVYLFPFVISAQT